MPVLLEHIHQPTDADWNDIEKIHQDTADSGLTLNRNALESWLTDGGWLMAGRFNDRLVGVVLAKNNGQQIELSHAGVRKLTQKRGVMHQLLHFICDWSQQQQKTLVIETANQNLQQSLQKRGFIISNGSCYYQPHKNS